MTDEAEISRKYRELRTDEPPRALDEAILAAARREAGAGPAPLQTQAARGDRQRWYAPLATAAVLVLAVAVTLNMQLERPGIESPAPQPAPQRVDQSPAAASPADTKGELKRKATADLKLAPKPAAEADTSARRRDVGHAASAPALAPATPAAPAAREPQPFAANQAPERAASRADARSDAQSAGTRDSRGPASSVTGESARQLEERTSRDAEAAERAPRMGAIQSLAKRAERAERAEPAEAQEKSQAAKQADTPERELERIAELRRQGKHDEADKALAEFRKRFPDHRIPDVMRERVEWR